MGQLDKQPENSQAGDPKAAEAVLRSMTQDIENLRQKLVVELSQDVERLQKEKSQLIEDIEKLQNQRQAEISQQEHLAKQIAPALANQLQELLTQRLNQIANPAPISNREAPAQSYSSRTAELGSATLTPNGNASGDGESSTRVSAAEVLDTAKRSDSPTAQELAIDNPNGSSLPPTPMASDYNENAYRLIASLDATLRTTFRTLQRDLNSYQSSLSQQLGQMYNLEQQGEAILEALVSRLREEIQSQPSAIQNTPPPPPPAPAHPSLPQRNGHGYREEQNGLTASSYPSSEQSAPAVPLILEPEPPTTVPQLPPQPQPASKAWIGFLLVLLSWLALSFEYIVITVIFNKSSIFGLSEAIGGFLSLNVGNLLVILWLRMLVVVPLMAVLGTRLYSGMWQEIRQFAQLKNWRLFVQVAISGGLRFMSELLLYLALGTISPGVALTIFFIYPIVITLLGWVRLGDRFSRFSFLRSLIILSVLVGFVLVTLPNSRADELSHLGISAAIGSALAFAFHLILSQTYAPKFNRIALSWINFVLILAFSSLSLAILPLPESWNFDVAPALWPTLLISCVVLGGTTLVNYLLNNIGSRMIGAGKASILGTTVPALTAILALVIIQQTMQVGEIFGMLLVTLGVAALSFEQWRRQTSLPQPAVRESK